jgi:choline dehydrogenase-like flavoprotein
LATGNVAVYADCRIREAEKRGDRLVAVAGETLDQAVLEGRGRVRVTADRFVLSGGPVGSPLFLQAHGLSDSAHVGEHLVVHPTVGTLARFPFPIRAWHGVTQGCYVDCWDRGFLLQTYTVTPDQYFLLMPTAIGSETLEALSNLAYYGSAGTLVHDEDSEGRVSMSPVGPDLYYNLGDVDRRRLIEGLRLCGRVFFAAGANQYLPARAGGGPIERESDIDAALPLDLPAHHLVTYASHPMGTCRMGGNRSESVCDPTGRVWSMANLWVADASLFPTSLGVNPQITTMALALMVGEYVAA